MNQYRDPLASLESQVMSKRAQLEDREHALSPVLRALLPSEVRQAVHELQPRAQAEGESMEVLSDVESALDAILALYDDALSQPLRGCEAEMRDPPRPNMPPPWLFEERYLRNVREAASARLLQIHPDSRVVRWGDYAYMGRFWLADAPCALTVSAHVLPDAEVLARHHSSLRTTIPASLGALDVSLERTVHVVGKALGLAHEVEVGDPAFDGRFWIVGSEIMTALLTAEVRSALEQLADQSPVLRLGSGLATLTWSAHWERAITDAVPDAALGVLAGLRNAIAFG